ncbi:neural cell adhesion molecule 1-like isoform X1 [Aphis gossypii]|uniref:neural cell adhesion molecule 1-like isoform X1 n=1 Tax=Aphis gossypii TaxID=80765 RepID=UPI002158D191|nr:neural cell adhesion molecule 1-like isoform X1 [Aphis gossypii]XP_050061721.1 neural cell adhesion molecule 1-like isoform X1 [Aphis gossypii]XP_050061722.1 neural cell adhesion molecule 1-like isoform X1 [Aphis gossypii]
MTIKTMTATTTKTAAAAVATATTPRRRRASGLAKMTAFLLVAAVVLADVIRVCECRNLREDDYQLQRVRRQDYDAREFLADGPGSDEDEDSESQEASPDGAGNTLPVIQTSGLVVETIEGTTVNLPCKVLNGSVDDYAVMWINGTKSIMTDSYTMTTDPRVKPGPQSETSAGFQEHTLIIEQVTRMDSGSYTCRIASTPPVEITHTLRVTHPAKVLSVQSVGSPGFLNNGAAKKLTVKQGEPLQLVCTVAGYPEPTVQWTKKAKYHQQSQQPSIPSLDHDQKNPDSAPLTPSTTVVSKTNEVRIDSVVAYRDAGYYECSAHNSITTGSSAASVSGGPNAAAAHMGIEVEIEFSPEIVVPRLVVNTGEGDVAQMACSVHAYPKVKVTWEKEILNANGPQSSAPVVAEGPNSRYDISRQSISSSSFQALVNTSAIPVGPTFVLKVKQVQGPQDFGRYRCRAENRVGVAYSDYITLTGSPAKPQSSYVHVKDKAPELAWTVDSSSPLLKYQLQYRRQQDSADSWVDVKPQPQVQVASSTGGNSGDERRYTMSYLFGGDSQPQQQPAGESMITPIILRRGTTYVARLRAENVHGWSDWSSDIVFTGGLNDDQDANEITQYDGHQHNDNISKASVAGTSDASGLQQYSALVTSIVLAIATVAVTAASVSC